MSERKREGAREGETSERKMCPFKVQPENRRISFTFIKKIENSWQEERKGVSGSFEND